MLLVFFVSLILSFLFFAISKFSGKFKNVMRAFLIISAISFVLIFFFCLFADFSEITDTVKQSKSYKLTAINENTYIEKYDNWFYVCKLNNDKYAIYIENTQIVESDEITPNVCVIKEQKIYNKFSDTVSAFMFFEFNESASNMIADTSYSYIITIPQNSIVEIKQGLE